MDNKPKESELEKSNSETEKLRRRQATADDGVFLRPDPPSYVQATTTRPSTSAAAVTQTTSRALAAASKLYIYNLMKKTTLKRFYRQFTSVYTMLCYMDALLKVKKTHLLESIFLRNAVFYPNGYIDLMNASRGLLEEFWTFINHETSNNQRFSFYAASCPAHVNYSFTRFDLCQILVQKNLTAEIIEAFLTILCHDYGFCSYSTAPLVVYDTPEHQAIFSEYFMQNYSKQLQAFLADEKKRIFYLPVETGSHKRTDPNEPSYWSILVIRKTSQFCFKTEFYDPCEYLLGFVKENFVARMENLKLQLPQMRSPISNLLYQPLIEYDTACPSDYPRIQDNGDLNDCGVYIIEFARFVAVREATSLAQQSLLAWHSYSVPPSGFDKLLFRKEHVAYLRERILREIVTCELMMPVDPYFRRNECPDNTDLANLKLDGLSYKALKQLPGIHVPYEFDDDFCALMEMVMYKDILDVLTSKRLSIITDRTTSLYADISSKPKETFQNLWDCLHHPRDERFRFMCRQKDQTGNNFYYDLNRQDLFSLIHDRAPTPQLISAFFLLLSVECKSCAYGGNPFLVHLRNTDANIKQFNSQYIQSFEREIDGFYRNERTYFFIPIIIKHGEDDLSQYWTLMVVKRSHPIEVSILDPYIHVFDGASLTNINKILVDNFTILKMKLNSYKPKMEYIEHFTRRFTSHTVYSYPPCPKMRANKYKIDCGVYITEFARHLAFDAENSTTTEMKFNEYGIHYFRQRLLREIVEQKLYMPVVPSAQAATSSSSNEDDDVQFLVHIEAIN